MPSGPDPELLAMMPLRVPARGGTRRLSADEVERGLITGEHARVLETYFGEGEYAELCALASRAARVRRRGCPRVLILPGILGSTLARMHGARADTLWVDFWDIARGRLGELRLPDAAKVIRPTGAYPGTYLKLKLWLRAEGFDADDHPFDWRRTIPDLGRELAQRVAAEPAREVFLVAHSMGGLVARAALAHGLPKLKRLIMLGTPNYGSFAPVMVFRGAYGFLKIIALLDLSHSAAALAGTIFNTFPGLTEMLPHRAKFRAVDLFDIRAWPAKGPRPLEALLRRAPAAQARLALPPPEKAALIAGVARATTTGLRVEKEGFVYEQSDNGDGTVPVDFALLPGIETHFIREGHGELPKNRRVWQAVKELMAGAPVSPLESQWSPDRTAPTSVREADWLAARASGGRGAPQSAAGLRPADLRDFLDGFASGAPPPPRASDPPPAADLPLRAVVVGRRRQRRVDIRLAHGSLTQVRARAYVIGLFEGVQPAGAALAIDAQMNGAVTDFCQRRLFSGTVGGMFMLPSGRNELRADHVLFAGLGTFDRFGVQVLETVAENLARTLRRTDIEEFATVPIGVGSGIPVESGMRHFLLGLLRGLADADADHRFRGFTICELDPARYEALKWTLYRLSGTPLFEEVEVTLSEIDLPPPAPAAAFRAGGIGSIPTVYLTVRSEPLPRARRRLCSWLLTSGAKATVISGEMVCDEAKLVAHLARVEKDGFRWDAVPAFGDRLARMVLPPDILGALEGSRGCHVAVVHDADAARIPWETLHVGGRALALADGMSRRHVAANMSVAKWLERRREAPTLNLLLVVNPTGDLPGADIEGARIEKLLGRKPAVRVKKLAGDAATRARLLEEFASGEHDVVHYAGHACFDPARPGRGGLLCSDAELTGADLAGLARLPGLVFFNACESGRVRRARPEGRRATRSLRQRIERSVGVAEAFLRGGVSNYLGTYWPVGDAAAEAFATAFYASLADGASLGQAVRTGREAVHALCSPDWADYLQYGNLEFAIKRPGA